MKVDKNTKKDKKSLLEYFRNRALEFLGEVNREFGKTQFKQKASLLNKYLVDSKNELVQVCIQESRNDGWSNEETLEAILMITYSNYIVMLESRNEIWPYEYMTFSRRIGELWEPFCKLCFEYPVKSLSLFIPPLFSEVKMRLTKEITDYISNLKLEKVQKENLLKYYNKVWGLVTSGEIKLQLDLHFTQNAKKYVVDFKSGFGSNEKGNTNRLLLVASIYKNLEEDFNCMIFVRSHENNNYFTTLKNSKLWNAYSGYETYEQIKLYTGYDLSDWIKNNVNWELDFKTEMFQHIKKNKLNQYLSW